MRRLEITDWKCIGVPQGTGLARKLYLGLTDESWFKARVPGSLQQSLVDAGLMPDPRMTGDLTPRVLAEQEWWFAAELPQVTNGERAWLRFDGLNTRACIWLNGSPLGETANMFMPYEFEITALMQPEGNRVAVRLDSGNAAEPDQRLWGLFCAERLSVRKCQMDWGWDFSPYVGSLGLWRNVTLLVGEPEIISDVRFRTQCIQKNSATLEVLAELQGWSLEDRVVIEIGGQSQEIPPGDTVRTIIHLQQPRLWWPHDIGTPHLYELSVRVYRRRELVGSRCISVGIRTLRLLQQPLGLDGTGFYFLVNDRPVFCKGANWVPIDAFPGEGREKYDKLITMARDAGMNMIRVWGGGIYEDERFYELCDRMGILVWQDFAFACGTYPDYDEEFCQNIRREAAWVVRSLRNHACLAIWCGNNECDWKHATRYWEQPGYPYYGYKIFHEILPSICAELDGDRPYWPSSPYGGPEPNSQIAGDTHDWQVWHGLRRTSGYWDKPVIDTSIETCSYQAYRANEGKFVSEFGLQGTPRLITLEKYWGKVDLSTLAKRSLERDAETHQRLMEALIGAPRDPRDYCLRSMMLQAEGLKVGIEHFRRHKATCGGCLVWQLNDAWPAISWSLIDYDCLPKASYFYVRRAMKPLLLSFEVLPDRKLAIIWGINDTNDEWNGLLRFGWSDFDGGRGEYRETLACIPANGAVRLDMLSLDGITDQREVYLWAEADPAGPEAALEYLVNPVNLRLVRPKITVAKEGLVLTVTADRLVRFFHFECRRGEKLADNFVDLLPGRKYIFAGNSLPDPEAYNYYLP